MSLMPIRLKSKIWQRERIVGMILCFSVVARMKMAYDGRLLQRLEERVEGRVGKHVHLVNDVDLVPAGLRGVADLVHEVADVVHGVVGGRVEFVHVEGSIAVEAPAGVAGVTGFRFGGEVLAVDRFG
jgi:hypothetical protein